MGPQQGGPDAQTKSVQDLVTGKGSPDVESVHLNRRSSFPGLFQVLLLGARLGGHALEALPTVNRHSSTHHQEFVLCHKTGLKGLYPEVVINRDIILNVYTALALKLSPLPAPYKLAGKTVFLFVGEDTKAGKRHLESQRLSWGAVGLVGWAPVQFLLRWGGKVRLTYTVPLSRLMKGQDPAHRERGSH